MNTIEHLRELFAYNDWANRRLIVQLKSGSGENSLKILAHILITEKEYFERLYGKDSTGHDFWQNLTIDECSKLTHENYENYERLLKTFDDEGLGQTVDYKTSKGVSQQNTFREMLTHVVFHSAAHRGQINKALREEGFEPINTDYIIYLRNVKS